MLKLKPMITGLVLMSAIFFLGLCLLAAAGLVVGKITASGYLLGLEILSGIAVFLGAFVAARIAWGRGAIYGGMMALFWVAFRLVYSLAMNENFDTASFFIKSTIILCVGLVAGAIGIGKSNRRVP